MVELGIPSLSAFYDMTWREFQLRRIGYERVQLKEWEKYRLVAYWSGIEGGFSPKKVSIEQFMPLHKKKKQEISQSGIEALRKAQEEYYGSK